MISKKNAKRIRYGIEQARLFIEHGSPLWMVQLWANRVDELTGRTIRRTWLREWGKR